MNINFQLGAASASAQIEGGNLRHNWMDWYEKGRIRDGASPGRANDHLHRWKEDIDLMADMGIRIYRLSIEWARIEPAQGSYDTSAVEWYRQLLEYIKSKGIAPLLTIHHFTNPLWFEETGGFTNPANIPVFLGFVEYAVRRLGDLADEYVTINEPGVFAIMGYYAGIFPPGKHSMQLTARVQSVMASCHVQAYKLIHSLRREMGFTNTKVGFAHAIRPVEPKSRGNLWHRLCARIVDHMIQSALTKACLLGRFVFPLKRYTDIKPGEYSDFLGLNYYTRSTVSGLADGTRAGAPINDLGWEIYPQGIEYCARLMHNALPRPIYITENGTCDNNDAFRCRFIYEHLKILSESDLPVERYYHWCFTDNFEWCEGESARFGLVHVDYPTQTRMIKKSGRFYSAIIEHKGVNAEMLNEYVNPQEYHV